jgi:hypothetical protein
MVSSDKFERISSRSNVLIYILYYSIEFLKRRIIRKKFSTDDIIKSLIIIIVMHSVLHLIGDSIG